MIAKCIGGVLDGELVSSAASEFLVPVFGGGRAMRNGEPGRVSKRPLRVYGFDRYTPDLDEGDDERWPEPCWRLTP